MNETTNTMPEQSLAMLHACDSCEHARGTNGDCAACLDVAMAAGSSTVTEDDARQVARQGDRFLTSPPPATPIRLLFGLDLALTQLGDCLAGRRRLPWPSVAMLAFAIAYVVNPFDAIPDALPGIGWVDDMAVVNVLFQALRAFEPRGERVAASTPSAGRDRRNRDVGSTERLAS